MALTLPAELQAMMIEEVTVTAAASVDGYGKVTDGADTTVACLVVDGKGKTVTLDGESQAISLTVYAATEDITTTDKITYNGDDYKIGRITTWRDPEVEGGVWGQELQLV